MSCVSIRSESTFFRRSWRQLGNSSTIVRGDVAAEVTKPKRQDCGDLIILGHSLLGETLLKRRLLDVLDLAIHSLLVGQGKPFFRDDRAAKLKLARPRASRRSPRSLMSLNAELCSGVSSANESRCERARRRSDVEREAKTRSRFAALAVFISSLKIKANTSAPTGLSAETHGSGTLPHVVFQRMGANLRQRTCRPTKDPGAASRRRY
jgi:hypothetical protein